MSRLTRRPDPGSRDVHHYLEGCICTARCEVCGKEIRFDLGEERYGKPKCCGVPMKLIADEKL